MKKLFLLLLFCHPYYFVSAQNQIKSISDENAFIKYEKIEGTDSKKRIKQNEIPLKISVKLDPVFSDTRARVRVDFPKEIDIDKVRTIEIMCSSYIDFPIRESFPTSGFVKSVYFDYKSINKTERFLETEFGALRPNTNFQIILIVLMNNIQELYIINNLTIFKTSVENTQRTKKLLLVIDKELENDREVNNALDQYINDAQNADDFINFEKYYIGNNFQEKWKLYNKVKEDYKSTSNPIRYLFFIGSNASETIERQYLEYNNTIIGTYYDLSINFYGQLNHPAFEFDLASNRMKQKIYRYYSFQGLPKQDLGNTIVESRSFDVSVSSIIPNSSVLSKKQVILNYFAKLHDYKTLKLTFKKSVLFSDTMFEDSTCPTDLSAISTRWKKNEVASSEKKLEYGSDNFGGYPKWTEDYISKLSTGSYEMCLFLGHGGPFSHVFNIRPTDIRNLLQLNTLFFDFTACSTGEFYTYDYMAGAYLEKGNTLFVRSYSVPIGVISYNNKSAMVDRFKGERVFTEMAKGKYFGDCFLDCDLSLYITVDLGDPLLRLDPVYVETGKLSSIEVCPGATIEVPFKLNTKTPIDNDFSVQLSDRNGENFVNIPAQRENSVFKITIPDSLEYGTNYKLKVVSSNDNIGSKASLPFSVIKKPSVQVTKSETLDNFLLTSSSNTGNEWLYEGQEISNAVDYTHIPEKPGNYSVRVVTNGCSVISDNSVLISIDKPVITIAGDNPSCMWTMTGLKAPEGYSIYRWYYNNNPPKPDTIRPQMTQVFLNISGTYRLAVGRGKIISPLSDLVSIVKKNIPATPTITMQNDGIISNSSLSTQWFFNDSLLVGETKSSIKIKQAGSYYAKVIEDGCSSFNSNVLVVTLTASEPTSDLSVKIYPNPNEGVFMVELPQTFEDWQIRIYDLTGKLVFEKMHKHKNTNAELINFKDRKGTYLMKVSKGTKTQTMKIVID